MSFVHLHTHSFFSLLDGTTGLEKLIAQAQRLKFQHLALTDHNALYGAVEFYRLAKASHIHPVIGSEIKLTDNTNLVLLVKDETGYRNLCNLLSDGHLRGGHLQFKLSLKDILPFKQGLIILSGGSKGLVWKLVKAGNLETARQYCRQMKTMFGENFYIELQRFSQNDLLLNVRLRDLAFQYQIPIVATNDVHLLSKGDWELRRTLQAIDQNILIDKVTTAGSPEQYLKSEREMEALFKEFPGALRNTEKVAKQCRFEFKLGALIFPKIDLPPRETGYSYLWKLAFKGAQDRYHIVTKELMDRLATEMNTVSDMGFVDYFLIVKDLVDFCHKKNIPCVGRGSAGDSLLSYLLGITQIDPLRYNLFFERFLNYERPDPPDIDLDICWKSRDKVLEYAYRKYGQDRTAMICTFNTFKLRSSIRDIARAFGFPEDEIAAITKYLPHYNISQLSQALKKIPECRHIDINTLEQALKLARLIDNFPRHLSIHPGGILIAPDDIRNYLPLQIAGKGIVISQYDMHSTEALGLVKIDVLGVRGLSVISDCLNSLRELYQAPANKSKSIYRYNIKEQTIKKEDISTYLTPEQFLFLNKDTQYLSPLDLRVIPENDPNVIGLLRSGLSMGCFQTESPGMRGLLKKLQIDGIEDVIISIALIRPGAADSGMKDLYIERRAGLKKVEYLHPVLKPVLEETYGGIIYQEQVMQIAAAVANFSLGKADMLRRCMTKARDLKSFSALQKAFVTSASQNGIPKNKAQQIWQYLGNFVGYGFNKAHSCTYGMIAYQAAFLKYYFPVQYMTAALNNHGGFYSKAAYISECRRMGIRLLAPDINESEKDFTCRQNTILTGLNSVYELTEKTKMRIMEERSRSRFGNYYDFVQRVQPREGEIINLIKSGALRSIHDNEPELLLKNQLYFKNKRNRNLTESLLHQVNLLPYNQHQRILNEMELLGFSVADHPLALFEDKIDWKTATPSHQLEDHKGRQVTFIGWPVTQRRVVTRNKEYMKFLTLEDRYGLCEAVLFSKVYNEYGHLTNARGPYLITGVVQSRLPGEANLIVEKLEVIEINKMEGGNKK